VLAFCSLTVRGEDCVTSVCTFSTNIAFDSKGDPDTRPNTWGKAAYVDTPIPFKNVPVGYRVRIRRVYGDLVAWPRGIILPGSSAGVLAGLLTTSSGASPWISHNLGSSGCFFYIQNAVSQSPSRAPFDFNNISGGLLDRDNIARLRQAIWLNDTEQTIHMETTMVVEFKFEKEKEEQK
jgi:hypothetical protein